MQRIKVTSFPIIGAVLFAMSNFAAAELSADPIEELKSCARTSDKAARNACYEALGKRVLSDDALSVETARDDEPAEREIEPSIAEVRPAPAESNRLPEKIGGGDFEDKKPKAVFEPVRGHIRSCREGADGRWFFIFESGQVWKQSSGGNDRFKNCDFDVTITKDLFSYKMKIDGGRTYRVRRSK